MDQRITFRQSRDSRSRVRPQHAGAPDARGARETASAFPRLTLAALALVCALPVGALALWATHAHGPSTAQASSASATAVTAKAKASSAKKKRHARKRSTAVASAASSDSTSAAKKSSKAKSSAKKTTTVASAKVRRLVASTGPSLAAYKGLASWVDLYDDKAWADPEGAVADMAKHGVHTLFIETSNFHSSSAVMNSGKLSRFIAACHAHKMRVVAWYLPDMTSGNADYNRVVAAIGFKTPTGQRFDGFALDIESTAVNSVSTRNKNLATLSKRIRSHVGASYSLGAIIPSTVGLSAHKGYWDSFPYQMLASAYDVFLPMAYYSYHTHSVSGTYSDAVDNVRILRSQPGCKNKPIHIIGGISDDSSAAQVTAFVKAMNASHVYGASLYGWPGTTGAMWKALEALK